MPEKSPYTYWVPLNRNWHRHPARPEQLEASFIGRALFRGCIPQGDCETSLNRLQQVFSMKERESHSAALELP